MKTKFIFRSVFAIFSIIGVFVYSLIPKFETTEFDQEAILQISEGSTTTLIDGMTTTTVNDDDTQDLIEIEQTELDTLLENNKTSDISEYFETYLLIGSDRRTENSSLSRGFVQGQRADVIILALINNLIKTFHLYHFQEICL